jgi:hypothetical protein
VGVAVKHRQLVRQVGVFIEHPPKNSMASLNFTSAMLNVGTTFTFSAWFCITTGCGGFNSHLIETKEPTGICSKHPAMTSTTSPMISVKFAFPI